MTAIFDAIEFAARAHRGQCRKGTKIPYIVHPLAVAKILIDAGCPEDVVVAGILHDTVEDTPLSLDEIRHAFGTAVARIVEGASEPDKSKPWEERKAHTIESLKTASEAVLLVSCADKIENLAGHPGGQGTVRGGSLDSFQAGSQPAGLVLPLGPCRAGGAPHGRAGTAARPAPQEGG